MKLSIKTEITVVGAALLLAVGSGTLIWHSHQSAQEAPEVPVAQTTQEMSSELINKPSPSGKSISNESIDSAKKEKAGAGKENSQIAEAIAWLDSIGSHEPTQEQEQSSTEDKQAFVEGKKEPELTPELQRKIEMYRELASILPELKQLTPLVMDKPTSPYKKRWGELLSRIFNTFEPILRPPAYIPDGGGINSAPMFSQIAEYLGKELPFDGNQDYFSAEDYRGGTGGW